MRKGKRAREHIKKTEEEPSGRRNRLGILAGKSYIYIRTHPWLSKPVRVEPRKEKEEDTGTVNKKTRGEEERERLKEVCILRESRRTHTQETDRNRDTHIV